MLIFQGGYHIWRATNICMSMICWGLQKSGGFYQLTAVDTPPFFRGMEPGHSFGWMTSHDWVDNDCWWQGTLDTGQLSLGYKHKITWVRLTILLNFTENSSKLYSICRDKGLMSLRCFGSPIFSIFSWQNLSRRLQDWSMISSPIRLEDSVETVTPPGSTDIAGSWLEKPPHLQ